jgi:hypothetical protein
MNPDKTKKESYASAAFLHPRKHPMKIPMLRMNGDQ